MRKRDHPKENPLLSDFQMEEHVQLAIEGAIGRAVTREQPCNGIQKLQENSGRAAERIVSGLTVNGLRLSRGQVSRLTTRVDTMLQDADQQHTSVCCCIYKTLCKYDQAYTENKEKRRRACNNTHCRVERG